MKHHKLLKQRNADSVAETNKKNGINYDEENWTWRINKTRERQQIKIKQSEVDKNWKGKKMSFINRSLLSQFFNFWQRGSFQNLSLHISSESRKNCVECRFFINQSHTDVRKRIMPQDQMSPFNNENTVPRSVEKKTYKRLS